MQRSIASFQSGAGSSRRFTPLFALAALLATASVSMADLFVVDTDAVDRFDSSTGAIIQTNGNNTFATLSGATGITVGSDGLVYVADTDPGSDSNLSVTNRYNANTGAKVGGAFIPFANDASQLSNAQGIAFGPDGNFYVADEGDNGPVKAFDSSGTFLTSYTTTGGNAEAVAFDPALPGDLFVATGSTIEEIDLSTHDDKIIVQGDSDTFSDAADLAFGPDGKLYVLDISSAAPKIFTYNADGTGQAVFTDFSSPTFSPAVFQPADLAFGPDGLLYVSGLSEEALTSQQGEILKLSDNGSTSDEFVTNLNAPGFLAFTTVPEPASLLLFAGSLILGGRRSRRK
ncbi:MAG TPA: PEP-CTERM sorting domain-containing protein [Tepidisphaeraceae bacterium]